MADPPVIQVPHQGGSVDVANGTDYVLLVYGTDAKKDGTTFNRITAATLTASDGSAVGNARIRRQPPHWALTFPIPSVSFTALYTVTIKDTLGRTATSSFHLVKAKPPAKKEHLRLDLQPGDTVHGSGFYITGSSDPDVSLYSYMDQPGGAFYMGTIIETGPNYVFFYQNIPTGDGYMISVVEWENPPIYYTSGDITVENP